MMIKLSLARAYRHRNGKIPVPDGTPFPEAERQDSGSTSEWKGITLSELSYDTSVVVLSPIIL